MATAPVTQNQNPDTSLTAAETQQIIVDPQEWSTGFAKKIALQDFQTAETFRGQNHDRRFRESDRLLTGWRAQRNWEGTRIPRSNVPIYIGLQEIEVLLPRVLSVIFSDNPPFEFMPEPGSPMGAAFAIKNMISSQLRDVGKPGQFLTIREVCRRAYKSGLTYGAGPVEFAWLIQPINRTIYDRRVVAEMATVRDPQSGQDIQVATGKMKIQAQQLQDQRIVSKPLLSTVDVRDFYPDPNCTSPNPNDGQFAATRHLFTIEELKDYAALPGFDIPKGPAGDKYLLELANKKFTTQGDTSKQVQENWRGNQHTPTVDSSADPALKRIEGIRYWRKNRNVWILGREHVAYNQCNPYGMLPFLNSFYTDFLGRFYGFSICDLVEGDHKLAAEIINARIDELNLIIHAPIVRKRGMQIGKRFHPGAQWETIGNPREDVMRLELGSVNPAAFAEVNALSQRVQKLTGNTDAAAYGVASEGGDSSARTAHGVAAKTAAANSRIEYQVENFEDQFLEPLLYIMLALNKKYLDPNTLLQIAGPNGQAITLDPLTIMNADGQFEVRASAKMRTRQSLQSGGLQVLLQDYLNPAYQAQMAKAGRAINFDNIDQLVCDALNIPTQQLTRPLTQQEMQAQQQPPIVDMIRMMMQRERLQSQATNQESADETKLMVTVLKQLLTGDVAHQIAGLPYAAEIMGAAQPKQLGGGQ